MWLLVWLNFNPERLFDGVLLMQGGHSWWDDVQSIWRGVRRSQWPNGQGEPVECVRWTVRDSSWPAPSHSRRAQTTASPWGKTSPANQPDRRQRRRSEQVAAGGRRTEKSFGTIRYDTMRYNCVRSKADDYGQLSLAHGIETKIKKN